MLYIAIVLISQENARVSYVTTVTVFLIFHAFYNELLLPRATTWLFFLVQLPETKEEEEQEEDAATEEQDEHTTMAVALFNSEEEEFPSADEQRRSVETAAEQKKKTDYSFPVAEVWYRRWQEYVGVTKGSVPGQTQPPGPIEKDLNNSANNAWVDEEVWTRFVRWYGVAASHPLDRKCRTFRDETTFEVCLLSPFSGIVEHRTARLSRFEEIGYVECQLRWTFSVPGHRKSRLWISEKMIRPQFRQLLRRTRMLCEFLDDDAGGAENILALEVTDDRDGSWPTGETGEPEGELYIYAALYRRPGSNSRWKEFISGSVENYSRRVMAGVTRATEALLRSGQEFIEHHAQLLTEVLHGAEAHLAEQEERERTLVASETELNREEEELDSLRIQQELAILELEKEEKRISSATDSRRPASHRAAADHKIRLNVGGHAFTTSVATLTQDTNSMLAAMFSGRYELKQESDGSYFVDRDGTHFRLILNFLRDGGIDVETLPKINRAARELLTEARFYRIQGLVELVEDIVKQRALQCTHEHDDIRQN